VRKLETAFMWKRLDTLALERSYYEFMKGKWAIWARQVPPKQESWVVGESRYGIWVLGLGIWIFERVS
jgi:hypothetical protein